jgi:hypothetical protein
MITNRGLQADPPGGSRSRSGRSLRVIGFASLVAVVAVLIILAPRARAIVEADRARVVDEEDRAFCSRFGIGPETTRYADCVAALGEIRSRHDQRRADLFF